VAHAETALPNGAGRSLPATFRERGAYLPFTTPELIHARVRELQVGTGTMIFVPRLVGSRRAHFVPLRGLDETFALSVHDRAMYEQIMATRATTPAKIARIADTLAQDGLAGAAEMQRVRTARAEHRRARLRLFMFMIGDCVEQLCGDDDSALAVTPGTIASADGLQRACDALSPFAAQHDLDGQELIDRLERWARATACVGSVHGQITGYLTHTTDAMAEMARSLEKWQSAEPEESAEMAEWIVKACTNTLSYAETLYNRISQPATLLGESLISFEDTFRRICMDVEVLIWLTDGWGPLARQWQVAADADRFAQRDAVEDMVRYVPLLPNDFIMEKDRPLWGVFQKRQLNWQKHIDRPQKRKAKSGSAKPAAAPAPRA